MPEAQRENRIAWHTLTAEAAFQRLGTRPSGLTGEEAERRLKEYGPNELKGDGGISPLVVLMRQVRSPLIYILLLAALVTFLLGKVIDSIVILAVVVLNSVIGFTQEYRAEQSLRALARLAAPKARVIRDGHEREINARDIVPGDVVALGAGDRVPADLRIFRAIELRSDESALTGESLPVQKTTEPFDDPNLSLGDQTNMAYLGTVIVAGRGAGLAVRTGQASALGEISREVAEASEAATPLQQQMNRLARWIAVGVGIISVVIFVLGFLIGEDPLDIFTLAVALAVASVPEGLPVVLTVALAVGVTRMARRRAIVRKLPAVETLGSCTVICSDKTGTLTKNEMTVRRILAAGRLYSVTGEGYRPEGRIMLDSRPVDPAVDRTLVLALRIGLLSNEAEVYQEDGRYQVDGDPTEGALIVAARKAGLSPEGELSQYPVLDEVPFESERQYMATLHAYDGRRVIFVKGAPEKLVSLCTDAMYDDETVPIDRESVLSQANDMAREGLRVLAMAYKPIAGDVADIESRDVEGDLILVGLQGMIDPPRPEAIEAVARCQEAGIRVVMITGDHAITAQAIGQQMGIAGEGAPVLTGREIEAMSDDELYRRVTDVSIYARAAPNHKLRIVEQLMRYGEIVAVTGDGVNDAPALKSSHIGVAMGLTGTDVAKEAAEIVLSDDNFATIFAAVEEGRIAFANIRKVVQFLLSTGLGLVLTIAAAVVLLGEPLLFTPVQILWINLVTKGFQDVGLAFEPGERGIGRQPPRRRGEGVITALVWQRSIVVALILTVGTMAVYMWGLSVASPQHAQTLALTTLVFFQFVHVFNSRSDTLSVLQIDPLSNRFLFVGLVASAVLHIAALYLEPLQFFLQTQPLGMEDWAVVLLVSITVLIGVELEKLIYRRTRGGTRHGL